VYLYALKELGDPRAQDFKIEGAEMHWAESLWLLVTLFGVVFVWIRSLWHSFQAREIAWFVLILFFWPAAGFYAWKQG